jgi:hypothetical protein
MLNFFRHRRHATAQRLFVLAALGGFLAATVGVPVIVTDDGKDRSQPYPCMDHACGCKSAEACWRGCCCFTMAQKLAWAEARGVTPPAFVVAAAQREAKPAACCQTSAGCCSRHVHPAHDHGPLESDHDGREPASKIETTSDPGWNVAFVLADSYRQCQGLGQLWLVLGAAMPATHVEFSVDLLPAGEAPFFVPVLASLSLRPAVPPPRSV